MNRKFSKIQTFKYILSFGIVLLILLGYGAGSFAETEIDANPELLELTDSWEYLDEASETWKAFSYPGKPPVIPGGKAVLERVRLPQGHWRDACLFVKFRHQVIQAYIDGKEVYRFRFENNTPQNSVGSPWHVISLDDGFQGKWVVFKAHSTVRSDFGRIMFAYVGSRSEFIAKQLSNDLPDAILALTFVLTGICTAILMSIRRRRQPGIIPLGFFSIFIGLWVFAETGAVIKLVIVNDYAFWYQACFLGAYMMPVGFCLSVRHFFTGIQRLITERLWQFFCLYAAVTFTADLTGILPIIHTMFLFNICLIATIVIIGAFIVHYSLQRKAFSRILICGYAALTITGLYDILGWYFTLIPWSHHTAGWGMLVFMLSLILILDKIYADKEQKLKQALEYDKLKNEFFANISHEFRTPLNIILGNIQLVNHYIGKGWITSESKDLGKYTGIMKQNCYRLLKLINNLIDITRIDSGYLKPFFRNCNLIEIVKEITLSVADYAETKGLTVELVIDRETAITSCDPEKIERILLNLLSNAFKFTPPGGKVTVTVECGQEETRISVADTGIGIPPEKQDMIFERFGQVDRSLSRCYEGSGIGLSLVRSLVEMHHGTVCIQSEPGKGSCFTITLPMKRTDTDDSFLEEVGKKTSSNQMEKINIEFSDIPAPAQSNGAN